MENILHLFYFITVAAVTFISIFILLLKNVFFYLLQILLSESLLTHLLYLLQRAKTIEILSQIPFVEKIKVMMTTKLSFICWHIVLQITMSSNCCIIKKPLLVEEFV